MILEPMYAIYRMQTTSGTWYSVVHFSRNGKMFYKRFYEPKHGGTENARQAAIAWRDEMLATIKPMTLVEFSQKVRSNNTSGTPGVTFHKRVSQPEGFWQASLALAGGRRITKAFSVLLYGERQAFELAVQARQEMLDQAEDRPYLYSREALKSAKGTEDGKRAVGVKPQSLSKSQKR
jgi:AP2 domain